MNNGRIASSARPGLPIIFVMVAGLLLASVGVTYWAGMRALEINRQTTARRLVIEHLDRFLSTVKDAETGQRGYLLTGQDPYLEPYHGALAAMRAELDALAEGTAREDLSEAAVTRLQGLANEKMAELELTIRERREHGLDSALAIVFSDRGRQIMEEIRAMVGDMRNQEEADCDRAARAADRAGAIRTVIFVLTALVNLVFLAWAYRRIAEEMVRREAAVVETARQKELLATTLASIGDGVIVTDTGARVTFMNRVAAALTGWSPDDVQGIAVTDVFKIINEQTRAAVENPVDHVLRTGAVAGLANHTLLVHKDGRVLPIDDSGGADL